MAGLSTTPVILPVQQKETNMPIMAKKVYLRSKNPKDERVVIEKSSMPVVSKKRMLKFMKCLSIKCVNFYPPNIKMAYFVTAYDLLFIFLLYFPHFNQRYIIGYYFIGASIIVVLIFQVLI